MATVAQEFGELIDRLTRERAGFKMGRMPVTREGHMVAGPDLLKDIISMGMTEANYMPHVGADMAITVDKEDFANLVGRVEAYKHIPYRKGAKAMAYVAEYVLHDRSGPVQTYFRDETGPIGPWPALSDLEKEWRIDNADETGGDPGGKILQYTGDLKRAVTDPSKMVTVQKTGQYARMIISGDKLPEGDNLRDKFFTHLLGSLNGWGRGVRIPARPFIPIEPGDLNEYQRKRIKAEMLRGIEEGRMEDVQAMAAIRR